MDTGWHEHDFAVIVFLSQGGASASTFRGSKHVSLSELGIRLTAATIWHPLVAMVPTCDRPALPRCLLAQRLRLRACLCLSLFGLLAPWISVQAFMLFSVVNYLCLHRVKGKMSTART